MSTLWLAALALAALPQPSASNAENERLFEPGTRVRVSAVAEEGWVFVRWEGSFASEANPLELTMDSSTVLRPVFQRKAAPAPVGEAKDSVSLEVASVPGGRIEVAVLQTPVKSVEAGEADLLAGIKVIERPGRDDAKENYPATAIDIPGASACIEDPEFGTRICRVSDAASLGFKGAGVVPMYSGTPAWNADESLLLLYAQGGPGHQLFRGQPPYSYIGPLGVSPGEPEAIYWDVSDPLRLRYVDKGFKRLMTIRVESGESPQVIHDFQDICGSSENDFPLLVETHHWQSFDGRDWGFKCDPRDGTKRLFLYDLETDRVLWNVPYTGSSTRGIWGAPMPSPSGKFVVTLQDAIEIRDRDTGSILRTIKPDLLAFQHLTMGVVRDKEGRERDVYLTLYNEGPPGQNTALIAIDLETGKMEGAYLSEAYGYPYPPSGIHHSAISYRQPNFVWTSIIGAQNEVDSRQTDGQLLLGSEILVTDLRDGRVGRVAHHRSRRGLNPAYNDRYSDYWQEPHVSVSPTGCRAVFGSDWSAGPRPGTTFQPKVDTFVVELPCFTRGK